LSRLTWLVKRQVTIFANAGQEKIDPTSIFNALLICRTLAYEVLNGAVEEVHLVGWDVNLGKELREPAQLSGRKRRVEVMRART
jgi:hypothetical protein